MKVCEKIKFMRQIKELSQEEMAEKLGLSLNGYTNIERGHADAPLSRIKQIADVLNVDLIELLSLGEKNTVYLTGGKHSRISNISHNSNVSAELTAELEKANLIIEAKNLEIAYLKEIIELMKANQNQCA